MFGVWIIILFITVRLSHQTNYTCDPMAACGCSENSAVVNRIVNGEDAGEDTWSWAVSIMIAPNDEDIILCGGTILSESWVLTAANCLDGIYPGQVTVYAGSNIKFQSAEGVGGIEASDLILHPQYDNTTTENDIALIQLSSPLPLADPEIKEICLPDVSNILENTQWPYVGTSVVAVGWGALYENGPSSEILQQVTLETLDPEAPSCSRVIRFPSTSFCASVPYNTKDTCQGDSGGPLMAFSTTRQWVLVGITSFGIGCAEPGYADPMVSTAEPTTSTDTMMTYPPINLHGNIAEISIYSVFVFLLFNFLLAVYF